MEDMSVFWSWLQSGKAGELLGDNGYPSLSLDLKRLLLTGESAGKSSTYNQILEDPGGTD